MSMSLETSILNVTFMSLHDKNISNNDKLWESSNIEDPAMRMSEKGEQCGVKLKSAESGEAVHTVVQLRIFG